MIRIRDLALSFFDFWEAAKNKSQEEQLKLWQELYESKHPEIFELYFSEFALRKRLPEALTRYQGKIQQLITTEERVASLVQEAKPRAMELFEAGDEEIDLDVVIMVGAYGGDGFTTNLQGRPTVFYAVEVLSEYKIERMQILIAHELSHGIHDELLRNAHPKSISMMDKKGFWWWVAKGAFMEGLATCGSERIFPGFDEHLYLFYSREQGDWCQRNRDQLIELILKDLESRDKAAFYRYFWSDKAKTDLPYIRTGYSVGYLAIEQLLKQYTLRELAELEPGEYPRVIGTALREIGRQE